MGSTISTNLCLHKAAYRGDTEMVRRLLNQEGADVNIRSNDHIKNTPLHLASQMGNMETAKLLLERGAAVDATDRSGRTSLHDASFHGHTITAGLLLDNGAAQEARDDLGDTPLHKAAYMDRTDTIQFLLHRGACFVATNMRRDTPLDVAAAVANEETVRLLMTQYGDHGWKALCISAERGKDTTLDYLLDLVDMGANEEGQDVSALLRIASSNGRENASQLILGRGANVETTTRTGATALHLAASSGSVQVVKDLRLGGAKLNATMQDGATPLHVAASLGHKSVVTVLLVWDANVDATTSDGKTPLYLAVVNNHVTTAECLLHQGKANVHTWLVVKEQLFTPLLAATLRGYDEMARLLLRYGAYDGFHRPATREDFVRLLKQRDTTYSYGPSYWRNQKKEARHTNTMIGL